VTLVVIVAVGLWYLISAHRTFTGPVSTLQFADDGVTVVDPEAS
jgi:hypothetical protein